jgi:hypothetical protein
LFSRIKFLTFGHYFFSIKAVVGVVERWGFVLFDQPENNGNFFIFYKSFYLRMGHHYKNEAISIDR